MEQVTQKAREYAGLGMTQMKSKTSILDEAPVTAASAEPDPHELVETCSCGVIGCMKGERFMTPRAVAEKTTKMMGLVKDLFGDDL